MPSRSVALLNLALSVAVFTCITGCDPAEAPVTFQGSSAQLPRTQIVPTLDKAIEAA